MNENWRPIQTNTFVQYEVSSRGRVRTNRRMMVLTATPLGYMTVRLCDDRTKQVHRLVAAAFLGPPPSPKHQVNHIDGNPQNNRVENLEWVTPRENAIHSVKVLGRDFAHGERFATAKMDEVKIHEIMELRRIGKTIHEIASTFGVSDCTISRVLGGKVWRHVERQAE